jgi:hypothetical protein
MLLLSDTLKYSTLAAMLLAILLAYFKGRSAVSATGQSLAWTHVPLIALLIVSVGPSAVATILYLGYKVGLFQAGPSGYQFSIFIYGLPLDFAAMNWGFAALYLVCRLLPNFGAARSAMWFSVTAMSLLNVPLFFLAPEMISNVFDAGQGIGVVQAMLSMPIWFGPYPSFIDPESVVGFLLFAPLTPMPFSGLVGWIAGQFLGGATGSAKGKTARS